MLWRNYDMAATSHNTVGQQLASNEEQWIAYESTGNFIALAGPGSGKTKVLTAKLARIINEDIESPRGVACVTYSNECARELKRRLIGLGVQPSRRVFVGTVHSFCFQHIVRPFAELGGLGVKSPIRVATTLEQDSCFDTGVEKAIGVDENPIHFKFRCSNYRRLHLNREAEDWYGSDRQAARVIEEYEKQLRKHGLIDYDDMVLLGLRLVEKHAWVRRALQAKFPALVVDEYQDLGVPLHQLVLSLCFRDGEANSRLFAVGDPDQSIYGFTGARPDLLKELSKHEKVNSVTLRLNYRSRQDIISAAELALGERRGYESANKEIGIIDFHHRKDGLPDQAKFIADTLLPSVLESGVASSLGQIAVLYRTKYEGEVIAEEISTAGLEFIRIDGNAAYPKTPLTRWLEECAAWCSLEGQFGSSSLRSIINDYIAFNQKLLSERGRLDSIHEFVACLRDLGKGDQPLNTWLKKFSERCLLSHLSAEPTNQEEIKTLSNLLTVCEPNGKLEEWTVARFGGQGGTPEHLNLMTLHSSKGLEFDVVIMFGMDQGILPSYREKKKEQKREPRRLFYVGLTRARHEVHLTFSGWRQTKWGRKNDGVSEFVNELRKEMAKK